MKELSLHFILFLTTASCLPKIYVDALLKHIPYVVIFPALERLDSKVIKAVRNEESLHDFYTNILNERKELEQSLGMYCKEPECLRICELIIDAMEVEYFSIRSVADKTVYQETDRSFVLVQMQFIRIIQREVPFIHTELFFQLKLVLDHILCQLKLNGRLKEQIHNQTLLEVCEGRYVAGMKTWIRNHAENFVNSLGLTIPSDESDSSTDWYKKATRQVAPKITAPQELDIFIEMLVFLPLEMSHAAKDKRKHYVTVLINLSFAYQRLLELRSSMTRQVYIYFEEFLESIYLKFEEVTNSSQ